MAISFCPNSVSWGDVATWVGVVATVAAILGSAFVAFQVAHRESEEAKKREQRAEVARLQKLWALAFEIENRMFLLSKALTEAGWSHTLGERYGYQISVFRYTLEPIPMEFPTQMAITHLFGLLERLYVLEKRLLDQGAWTLDARNKFSEKAESAMKLAKMLCDEINDALPEGDRFL